MTSPKPSLLESLPYHMEEVHTQALASIQSLHLPLLPPCLTKQEILSILSTHRQVCSSHMERATLLLLLTDLVTASLASPGLVDLCPTSKTTTHLLSRLQTEWATLFKELLAAHCRPQASVVATLHTALGRCNSLLPPGQTFLANCEFFFRVYNLPAPGRSVGRIQGFFSHEKKVNSSPVTAPGQG